MMSSESAIVVENISKRYRLGLQTKRAETFAEQLFDLIKGPVHNFRRLTRLSKFNDENDESVFWALKDVSYTVGEGEVLGIIGRNGAGKSTLLKILSRITEPTAGQIKIRGRVSSLLEVGTGFHPELSGKENIYMNGTILGMRKKEIDSKLEEIVEFSGVAKHINTPVKFYSSGMKVRLGFSVAAHLEPEILIIDEVLAVGDLEFQRKCLGKMEDVAGSGRTVIFVSHSMSAIRQLCTRCLVLKDGSIVYNGTVDDAINTYVSINNINSLGTEYSKAVIQNNAVELLSAKVMGTNYEIKKDFNADEEILIQLKCRKNEKIPGIKGFFLVRNESDEAFIESDTFDFLPNIFDQLEIGEHDFELRIPPRVLPKGRFKVYLNFSSDFSLGAHSLDSPKDILAFEIYDTTTIRGARRKAYSNVIVQWEKC